MGANFIKNIRLRFYFIAAIIFILILMPVSTTTAGVKYIKTGDFIKKLVQALEIQIDTTANETYIDAAIREGIVQKDEFDTYTEYITRTDAAVLVNRADEYLHDDTLDEKLLDFVLTKRISDIKKVPKEKREAVAKVVAKGIIKGYGNGYYIQNREFRGSKYLTKSGASNIIQLILNPDKRAKLSPDGQLIRTTKLPKTYKRFDYILECYPNSFYEMKMQIDWWDSIKDKFTYTFPKNLKNDEWVAYFGTSLEDAIIKRYPFSEISNEYLTTWTARVEDYLKLIFNVNYRTIGNTWKNNLYKSYATPILGASKLEAGIQDYVNDVKNNKVKIESKVISVEPSTLYQFNGAYYMRAYVKYKITAKDIHSEEDLLYGMTVSLDNLISGKWRTGVFDIELNTGNNFSAMGEDLLIGIGTEYIDSINVPVN